MTQQLDVWRGEFGQHYTDRNVVDPGQVVPVFQKILEGLPPRRILEVGCNRGHNLAALRTVAGPQAEVVGIEPNPYALQLAQQREHVRALAGDVFHLPFPDGAFELVFTAGVLIHIALANLPAALDEIYRCSRRYILAIEYFAEEETPINYRGHTALLWKRNFLKHYQDRFPDLAVVRQGYEESWDRSHWWLLEKPGR